MKIIFEDGREVESENPIRELTNVILNRTMRYNDNEKLRWPDYIFVLRGYKKDNPNWMSTWVQFSEVCVYVEDGGYKWIRNWWEGFDAIRILYVDTLLHAGNAIVDMARSIWDV